MRRDARLRGLSSDHHGALVLARKLAALAASGRADAAEARALSARFSAELEPHFRVEDELLLPALRAAGEHALADRAAADHVLLRAEAAAAGAGRTGALARLAARLTEHVRFEERELFPRCQLALSAEVFDAVARRAPHAR